jgi:hypothetical protein
VVSPEPSKHRNQVWTLPRAEQLVLVQALFARNDWTADGRALLKELYPSAPEPMVSTAAHHLYVDGAEALLRMLASLELSLRTRQLEVDEGVVWELLYHAYNWQQFQALLPGGLGELHDFVDEALGFVEEGDLEAIRSHLKEIKDRLEGHRDTPTFEAP